MRIIKYLNCIFWNVLRSCLVVGGPMGVGHTENMLEKKKRTVTPRWHIPENKCDPWNGGLWQLLFSHQDWRERKVQGYKRQCSNWMWPPVSVEKTGGYLQLGLTLYSGEWKRSGTTFRAVGSRKDDILCIFLTHMAHINTQTRRGRHKHTHNIYNT